MKSLMIAGLLALVPTLAGCSQKTSEFRVVDYREDGTSQRYFQPFDSCFYTRDQHGNLDIVARSTSTDANGVQNVQILHARTFWTARPGRTRADETMINTTVNYAVRSGSNGTTFEGSGFLTYRENRKKTKLKGQLEFSTLTPQRELGTGASVFTRAELSGRIHAFRDRQRVVETLNELNRQFGPQPTYRPAGNANQ